MFLNSWRMRLGLVGAAVILTGAWMLCGGRLAPGMETGVLIEFGADPDQFAGMSVEIDGEVAGVLERIGQATRTGFATLPGEHRVRISHPDFDCNAVSVTTNTPGQKTFLLLDYAETSGQTGSTRQALELRP